MLLALLSGLIACALPDLPPADLNAASTSAAQTVLAAVEQTQRASTAALPSVSPAPSPTLTAALPTLMPTHSPTATAVFTLIPLLVQINVTVPTNCRNGPGKAYEMVGALLVGETVQVFARESTGMYWYIRNPDSPDDFCWVWGEFATLSGNTAILPVYTPPPTPLPTFTATPAPDFQASYAGLDSCTGWWADIKLRNTGPVTFNSVGVTLKDMVTSVVVSNITDGFVDNTGCASSNKGALLPDKAVTMSAPAFSYDPTGHKVRGTLTLCSGTGLNGLCVTQAISFTP
jgi:hypothetical protein